ncbi:NUDIX family hydrolase [Saccharata proteae CBS 121410]|uniref:NUDIX family hydrolase n=1 Tax=Saccharata proteae CBS 121410 TaxID=1314787 RepID=A0A9P4HU11_9PEZI|nr:NUDIX family hydrolase [Saccharata proteae CBS 121410]
MSTFGLPSNPECPVHIPNDLTKEQLLNFPAFKNWISNLQHSLSLQKKPDHTFHQSPYKLRKIDVQSCDFFGGERLGFVKLQAEVTNDNGEYLPGAVFLRGGSVGMLLILQPDDVPEGTEEDKYVILTVQPRIAAGSLALTELPAGMLDDSGKFAGKAAAEIEEETGLKVAENELIDMTSLALPSTEETTGETLHKAMYPSAGGCDEFIPLFLHERRVKRKTLDEWTGKLTGLRDHGEKITLKLVPLEDLYSEGGRDAKALGAWALYRALREKGKLHTAKATCRMKPKLVSALWDGNRSWTF